MVVGCPEAVLNICEGSLYEETVGIAVYNFSIGGLTAKKHIEEFSESKGLRGKKNNSFRF